MEFVNTIKRRRVNEACLQKPKWKEDKVKELTDGNKLNYTEKNNANRVGMVIDIVVSILWFILNLKQNNLYLSNESHLQVNIKIQVWTLQFDTCFIKFHNSSDSAKWE